MRFTSYNLRMTFTWTSHRFSGGALALDVANSVILRFDAARSIDRFADPGALASFVPAALDFCGERDRLAAMQPTGAENRPHLLELRESIDAYFRRRALGEENRDLLCNMLEAAAQALRAAPDDAALEAHCARSALRLICEPAPERLKICGHCGWLFIDRSKNRSRAWCDMAVCGNRAKASRHYQRQRKEARA
jgi:predicted RNA-binding Zn ribbon-like protein